MKKITLLIALISTMVSYAQTPGGGLTDIDGNIYNTVIIGTQEWMQTNYNVSKFTDGTPIPEITSGSAWSQSSNAAWCYYNNDPSNGSVYGKLYNWYAIAGVYNNASVNDTSLRKQFAPTGWHVPTLSEWNTLTSYLVSNVGAKMKETGTLYWNTPNTGATNESGFTGLPGGERRNSFRDLGAKANWWSSNQQNGSMADYLWLLQLRYNEFTVYSYSPSPIGEDSGFSVRLIKNSSLNNHTFIEDNFKIYPNPAKDQITIDCGDLTNVSGLQYKIINTLGQEIINGKLGSQQNIIQLNNIKGQGVYFFKIINEQNEILSIKKIILQ